MKRRYVTIDVFTDRMFGGNPLAVVLDAAGLSTSQMQAIAIEFNYSETTFILPPKHRDHSAWVRIFTPGSEIPFAGHPNVGTAFALAGILADRNERVPEQFVFEEEAGLVPVTLIQENGAVIGAELLAPEPLSRPAQVTPESAAACLSLTAEEIYGPIGISRRCSRWACHFLQSNLLRAVRCAGPRQTARPTARCCRSTERVRFMQLLNAFRSC